MKSFLIVVFSFLALTLSACDAFRGPPTRPPGKFVQKVEGDTPLERLHSNIAMIAGRKSEAKENRIRIHHILVKKELGESEAAKAFQRVLDGEDFFELATEYDTSGRAGGPYYMVQNGHPKGKDDWDRSGMVKAFGDTGWRLSVGEVGVAPYNQSSSPYGWHIIKRLE